MADAPSVDALLAEASARGWRLTGLTEKREGIWYASFWGEDTVWRSLGSSFGRTAAEAIQGALSGTRITDDEVRLWLGFDLGPREDKPSKASASALPDDFLSSF